MIYEERRTLAHPKSADDYLKFCQTELFPELRHMGADPISLLSGLIGDPTNQHLQITAFEDMSVWEATQDKVLPLSNSMVIKESVRLIKPIASRPKSKVSAEDQRAVYGCRRFTINPADLQDFVNSSQNGIWPRIESQGACILGLWSTVATTQPMEILLLTGYHSPTHWEQTRITSREQTDVDQELRLNESPLRSRRMDISEMTWVRLMQAHWF